MKNTLEENMLRYGIKNLSESSKHRLTEALVDLMTHVNTTAALSVFNLIMQKDQITKHSDGSIAFKGAANSEDAYELGTAVK
jgi:hypothetical protein